MDNMDATKIFKQRVQEFHLDTFGTEGSALERSLSVIIDLVMYINLYRQRLPVELQKKIIILLIAWHEFCVAQLRQQGKEIGMTGIETSHARHYKLYLNGDNTHNPG